MNSEQNTKPKQNAKPVGALDRRDSANYLAISTRKLDDLAAAGEILKCKSGRKTVFRIVELDRYLESIQEGGE